MYDIKFKAPMLALALQRLEEVGARPLTRRSMEGMGRAGTADARRSIREGQEPEGRSWRPTKDGRQAFGSSRSLQNSIKFEILSDLTVRIGSDDVRAVTAHTARVGGSRINLRSMAIVPLSREIGRRVIAARGWGRIRAFRITTKSGKIFLAERVAGSGLNFLGVFKNSLKQYRRRFLGVGPNMNAAVRRLENIIAKRIETGRE